MFDEDYGTQLFFMQSSSLSSFLVPLGPDISPSVPYSQTPSAYVPASVWQTNFHTHTEDRQNYSSVHFNRYVIVYQTEHKIFCNKW